MSAKYALIGEPVDHSLSPAMQNAAFAAAGMDAEYAAMQVSRDGIAAAVDTLRFGHSGFNVTTPLKEVILPFVDALTDVAESALAVNTVRIEKGKLTGHNTDGAGFVDALMDVWKLEPRRLIFCFLGSGPAARAIAQAVARRNALRIMCWSRNPLTSEQIGEPPDSRPDILVSALPQDAEVPQDVLDTIGGATHVFDLNYRATRSPVPDFIGRFRTDGLALLLHQGAQSFKWWTGTDAPLEAMRKALG